MVLLFKYPCGDRRFTGRFFFIDQVLGLHYLPTNKANFLPGRGNKSAFGILIYYLGYWLLEWSLG